MTDKPNLVEELIDNITEDPDAPEKGNASRPPQTIDNEPTPATPPAR